MKHYRLINVVALLSAIAPWISIAAAPITITTPFLNFENDNINSDGYSTGQFLRFGADSVVPNGANGTTGLATTVNTVTGQQQKFGVNFAPSPLIPNFFERKIAINPALLGPYTLDFSNGGNSASTVVSLPSTAALAPFVQSVTLSGTSLNPTFTWTPPAGALVNGYRLNIYDKSLINLDPSKGPINTGQITNLNVQPNVTSHTVTAADFTIPGYAFNVGHNYSIEIDIIQTKDGSNTNLGNGNLASISRSFADFTPSNNGAVNVNLPVVIANGVYKFDMAVVPGQTYYIDPSVATGYDYQVGAGDPTFASVVLPTGIPGNFKLWDKDALGNLQLVGSLLGGQVFDFGAGGVSFFEVTGIDPGAKLDPNNPTSFVTGLTFTGAGAFDGTQTALTAFVASVPEPTTWALTGLGVLAVTGIARRRGRPGTVRQTSPGAA